MSDEDIYALLVKRGFARRDIDRAVEIAKNKGFETTTWSNYQDSNESLIAERDEARAEAKRLRDDLRQLITTFEAVLDTRTCATKTLRALNKARAALRGDNDGKEGT